MCFLQWLKLLTTQERFYYKFLTVTRYYLRHYITNNTHTTTVRKNRSYKRIVWLNKKKSQEKTNVNTCGTETHASPGTCEWASRRHERRHVCHWSWSNSWRPSWISFTRGLRAAVLITTNALALWLGKVISWNHALFQKISV